MDGKEKKGRDEDPFKAWKAFDPLPALQNLRDKLEELLREEDPKQTAPTDIGKLQEIVLRQQRLLEKVMSPPCDFAYVLSVRTDDKEVSYATIITFEGRKHEVAFPSNFKVQHGDTVKISSRNMQIVQVVEEIAIGGIASVKRVMDQTAEVEYKGFTLTVLRGKFADTLKAHDRVVLDNSGYIILANIGPGDERFQLSGQTQISWNDICGLEDAKKQLIEAVELPYKERELFGFYKKKPPRGILLFGPPGCGKTMLGEAIATAISKTYGKESLNTGFIYIKGAEILSKFVGVAEDTIRQLFLMAREHKRKHGFPAVIFMDEAEALLYERGTGKSSDIERTIVPTFLAEMGGLDEWGAIVILATNRPDMLDSAVIRDKRVDCKIEVPRPDRAGCREIFLLNLKNVPLKDATPEAMADFAVGEFFSPQYALYEIQRKNGEIIKFTLAAIVNGAMIAGIVENKATSFALQRDLKNKKREGVTKDDIREAIRTTLQENMPLRHAQELADFIRDFKEDVEDIRKLRQTMS